MNDHVQGNGSMKDGTAAPAATTLLQVRNLSRHFHKHTRKFPFRRVTETLKAVDNVSFDVRHGETLGIVGESGSGKTTAVRCVLRAINPTAGTVMYHADGRTIDVAQLTDRQLKPLRRQMQMIFQDPFSSLNPRMTVGDIVGEPLLIHGIGNRAERVAKVVEMLERVGMQADHMYRYPHAFSGGQRQRISIARALILRPSLVVADEAVSALDVSVRARVLDLLQELQKDFNLTYLFVSHDLSVIRQICDRVVVMYRGRIMEAGDTEHLFNNPRHAYTRVLLSAIPYPDPERKFEPQSISDLTPEQLEPLPEVA